MSDYPVMIKRLKGQGIVRVAAKHNLREIAAEIGAAGHIDPTRIHANLVLRGPTSADKVADDAKALMIDAGITRPRAKAVMALELVFTLAADTDVDVREYFEDATCWAERFYQVPVLSSVVHLDESAPHCHVLLLPIAGGHMVGSDLHGGTAKLIAMQASFHDQVRARYGMSRHAPTKRHSAAVRAEAMKRVQERLRADGWSELVVGALSRIEARNPEPLLLALDLPMPTPAARQSFVAIMTRPAKSEPQNLIGKARIGPIGIAGMTVPEVMLPYPCVGEGLAKLALGDLGKREEEMPEPTSASRLPSNIATEGGANSVTDKRAANDERVTCDDSDHADEPAERYTRERDGDHLAEMWDSERGGFLLPAPTKPSRKASVEAWARCELSALEFRTVGSQ